jgi:serine/threonine protein kinase/TPR repeat protein/sugar lactone lactonase YvrE
MNFDPRRVEELFDAALARPASERSSFLTQACANDDALRRLVEAMLRAHDEPVGPLDVPAVASLREFAEAQSGASPAQEGPGHRIGRYRLKEKIGEGGCGVVWLAEQEEPIRRPVALKIIKLGMDTQEVIARFEAERQALASMDHPNIAKVFDAGATENGRPYFVMELVRGVPITRYCDEHRLPPARRLELIIQVCHAIEHAHRHGFIHRDLKPSNILVANHDGLPVPKVIDFGIAKATDSRLTNQTIVTLFEQFIGTPAYMSPEQTQLGGPDVDPRSDIYSLGVLLYELLTGRPPFDPRELQRAGLDEMRRRIREEEPPKPSTLLGTLAGDTLKDAAQLRGTEPLKLLHLVRGDLDWIVMRALEKNRERRYATAAALATDLAHHLRDEPVAARPPSPWYRLGKFGRRHRLAFVGAGAMLLAVVAALVWPARRAPAEFGFITLAGAPGHAGQTDGRGRAARFDFPQGLAVDQAGNVYVADAYNSTIRKITPDGVVTTLAGRAGCRGQADGVGDEARFDGPIGTSGSSPSGWAIAGPSGVAVDQAGNVYIGDCMNHTVRKITAAGRVTTLAGTGRAVGSVDGRGPAARFNSPRGVAVGPKGEVYVADSANYTIRRISPEGDVTTVAGAAGQSGHTDGPSATARFGRPQDVAVDAAGTVFVADGNHTIRRISPDGTVTTLAGAPGVFGSADGTGNAARFKGPARLALDDTGNLLVADNGNSTIRKITPAGVVTTVAGYPGSQGRADGNGGTVRFYRPQGIAVDRSGHLYVADTQNHTIRKGGPGLVSRDRPAAVAAPAQAGQPAAAVAVPEYAFNTLAGTPGQPGSSDGTLRNARFNQPEGMAIDHRGIVYVADSRNSTIRQILPTGEVRTFAGLAGSTGGIDGPGRAARFVAPGALAVDRAGWLYVADRASHTIRRITPTGMVSTFAGQARRAGAQDGDRAAAQFDAPSGVAVDEEDNVYVADANNHTIRKITPDGRVTTLAGSAGVRGCADGTGAAARFAGPFGVAVDRQGNVFVSEFANHTIRKITPTGVVTTLAGLAGSFDGTDGVGAQARFGRPTSLAVDRAGNLYVTDSDNGIIRVVTPDGAVGTLAGVAGARGSEDAVGRGVRFHYPAGIAIDAAGNLYVADLFNHTIRKGTRTGVGGGVNPGSATAEPTSAGARLQRGWGRVRAGDYKGALEDYDAAVALDPTSLDAFYHRGAVRQIMGNFEGAASDFAQSVVLSPHCGTYNLFALCLNLRRLHREDNWDRLTVALKNWPQNQGWPRTIARYLVGQLPEEEFLTLAGRGDDRTQAINRADAHYYIGMARLLAGDRDLARQGFEKCVAINETGHWTSVLARAELARLTAGNTKANSPPPITLAAAPAISAQTAEELVRSAQSKRDAHDFAGAIADCDRVLALDSGNTLALAVRGDARKATGDLAGAIKDYDRAVELRPDDAVLRNCRGEARAGAGDVREAIADFDKAIECKPDYGTAYYNRGVSLQAKGDTAGAIADYSKAIELNASVVKAHINRGNLRQATGDLAGAIADFSAAIKQQPDDATAHYNRGNAKKDMGDSAGAIVDYTRAVALNPKLTEAYNNRGWLREQNGDLDAAIADYDRAIALQPNYAQAYFNRANAKKAKGDRWGAAADLDKALELQAAPPTRGPPPSVNAKLGDARTTTPAREPADVESQYKTALAHFNGEGVAKDWAEAARWFRKAAEQGHARSQFYLGALYAEGMGVPKDLAQALGWLHKAAAQKDVQAQYTLGLMYYAFPGVNRDLAEAMRWFRQAADQGDAKAQYYVGELYYEGAGVAKDPAEALKWLRKAAAQHNADAEFRIGYMYEYGIGVELSRTEAVNWYRKAAAQGHDIAKRRLGSLPASQP